MAGPYRDALAYAAAAKDNDGLEWARAAGCWRATGRPTTRSCTRRRRRASRSWRTTLTEGEKSEAAEKMLARLQEARRRDLEITLRLGQRHRAGRPRPGGGGAERQRLLAGATAQTVGGGILLGGRIGDKQGDLRRRPGLRRAPTRCASSASSATRWATRRSCASSATRGRRRSARRSSPWRCRAGRSTRRRSRCTVTAGRRPAHAPRRRAAAGDRRALDQRRRSRPRRHQRRAEPAAAAGRPDRGRLRRLAVSASTARAACRTGTVPEPGTRDEVAYQTRVSPFATNRIDATVQAVLSADRRYVRLSLSPTFNVVTGTQLQGMLVRNPIIPGFPVP